ncbi:transmembrane protein 126 [Megachile rotundata]|uniref:transmembrane protein 126 n=1 Tax=Megachile rotundata TaxID=143995 RepID=UPI003FD48363
MALLPVERDTFVDSNTLKETCSLTKLQALQIQKNLIKLWEPAREVWALKYGSYFVGISASMTSLMINSLFKRKLKLHYAGEIVTTLALMIGPAGLATFIHDTYITDNILLYKKQCPICTEVKASLYLNANAILYPLLLSPAITLAVAGNLGLRIPYIYEVKEISKFWWSVVKPAFNHLTVAFCLNSLLAGVVVYKQFEAADRMANVIRKVKEYTERNQIEKEA